MLNLMALLEHQLCFPAYIFLLIATYKCIIFTLYGYAKECYEESFLKKLSFFNWISALVHFFWSFISFDPLLALYLGLAFRENVLACPPSSLCIWLPA